MVNTAAPCLPVLPSCPHLCVLPRVVLDLVDQHELAVEYLEQNHTKAVEDKGEGGSDSEPHDEGEGGSDIEPHDEGEGGSDIEPHDEGEGGSDIEPHDEGEGGSDSEPHDTRPRR